ncbi:MAG: Holliday junction branch migration protein RuvA [Phototrophicales bacterium]
MIASIQGKIASAHKGYIVVVINGIGYKIFVPEITQKHKIGDDIYLYTHLVVREDSLTLFGFETQSEESVFEILLTISGVGPKVALSILSTLSLDSLRNAVVSDKAEILTRVPGIGKKTAQKILFELKDKLITGLEAAPITDTFDDINTDVIDALVALGYSIVEAQTAIQALPSDAPPNVEERIRLALQYFT